jgi:G6PDH family F420-dependent oxidoreductase
MGGGNSMTAWGYTLSSEEFGPGQLVEQSRMAEDAGFEFVTVSDHYHPWTVTQGQSPFAWTTIGGVGAATDRIRVGTGVTCPIIRYHPTIVAQAAATSASLLDGRFFLGVGTGEWLNEHIAGGAWPAIEVRREMLAEAVAVMRRLWTGETVDHRGEHFTVENARIFTVPPGEISVIVAASGAESAEAAADFADGLWSTRPDPEIVESYRRAGGRGPVYGQVTVCVAADEESARKTALEVWPNAGIPGQLSQDLPTWSHFQQVSELVTEDRVAQRIACGPDPDTIVELAKKYTDAGFDHLHFHQVGPDQRGFIDFWKSTLSAALP